MGFENPRHVLVLLVLVIASAAGLIWANRAGRVKHVYPVTRVESAMRVPVIHAHASGIAEWVGDDRVRIEWSPAAFGMVGEPDRSFALVGTIDVDGRPVYVLELDGQLYIEKAEFVELHLIVQRFRDEHGTVPPEVTEMLSDPDLDPHRLAEVLARLGAGDRTGAEGRGGAGSFE